MTVLLCPLVRNYLVSACAWESVVQPTGGGVVPFVQNKCWCRVETAGQSGTQVIKVSTSAETIILTYTLTAVLNKPFILKNKQRSPKKVESKQHLWQAHCGGFRTEGWGRGKKTRKRKGEGVLKSKTPWEVYICSSESFRVGPKQSGVSEGSPLPPHLLSVPALPTPFIFLLSACMSNPHPGVQQELWAFVQQGNTYETDWLQKHPGVRTVCCLLHASGKDSPKCFKLFWN